MRSLKEQAARWGLSIAIAGSLAACGRSPTRSETDQQAPGIGIGESIPNTGDRIISWNAPEYMQIPDVLNLIESNASTSTTLARENWRNTPGGSLFIGCADGRCNHALALGSNNYEEFGSLAGTVTNDMKNELLTQVSSGNATSIEVVSHTTLPDCVGCGAQGLKSALENALNTGTTAQVHADAEAHGIGHTANWVEQNIFTSNPGSQAYENASRAFELSEGKVPVRAWVFDHVTQRYLPIAEWLPGQGLAVSIDQEILNSRSWSGQSLSKDQLSTGGQAIMDANATAAAHAEQKAIERGFGSGQSFRRIVITDNSMPTVLMIDTALEQQPDQIFNTSLAINSASSSQDINAALEASMAGVDYALVHASAETEVIGFFRTRELAERALIRFQNSPAGQSFLNNTSYRSVAFYTYDNSGKIVDVLLVKPPNTAVGQLQLTSEVAIGAPAMVNETVGKAISTTEFNRIESLITQLQDSNPEIVQYARNELTAMGAMELDGQWVVMGNNWTIASRPTSFSKLITRFPDGKPAFVGINTPYGIIGFENEINIGWRINIPKANLNSIPLFNIDRAILNKALTNIATLGLVVYEFSDVFAYSVQTGHMAVWQNNGQHLFPPSIAHQEIWRPTLKNEYITTKWELSAEMLSQGWNGSGITGLNGAQIPRDKRVPIFLYGGLSGTDFPQQDAVSYGPAGNRIANDWQYQRNGDGTYSLWLQGQKITSGTTGNYFSITMNETGIWFIPYVYEYATQNHPGLFIQQAHGGEQVIFNSGSGQFEITQLDLCPEPLVPDECAPVFVQ